MSHRIEQLNDLIRDHVGDLFSRELSLKQGVIVTIARVDTTPDLRYTYVFVSVFPEGEQEYALKTLAHERQSLERALHGLLATRPLPRLEFKLDTTERKADVIEHILKDIENEK